MFNKFLRLLDRLIIMLFLPRENNERGLRGFVHLDLIQFG